MSVLATASGGHVLVTVLAAVLALAGCGASEPDDGKVHLRLGWWGSDSRHKATQAAIDQVPGAAPGHRGQGEFGDWGGYWDKLATTVAARDAPDVIQMDERTCATTPPAARCWTSDPGRRAGHQQVRPQGAEDRRDRRQACTG